MSDRYLYLKKKLNFSCKKSDLKYDGTGIKIIRIRHLGKIQEHIFSIQKSTPPPPFPLLAIGKIYNPGKSKSNLF